MAMHGLFVFMGNAIKNFEYKQLKSTGHSKYSLLGWSDGGITAMILAAAHPQCVHRMVVWGANATVTADDIKLYEAIRDTSKWSPKMREPLEGRACS